MDTNKKNSFFESNGYNVLNLILTISIVGIPVAITLMIIKIVITSKRNHSIQYLSEYQTHLDAKVSEMTLEQEQLENKIFELKDDITKVTDEKQKAQKNLNRITKEAKDLVNVTNRVLAFKELEALQTAYEVGIYNNIYDFDILEEYKGELTKIREQQKALVKDKECIEIDEYEIFCDLNSPKKYSNALFKLILRCFNNECDASLSKLNYKNFENVRKKINSSFDQINKLGAVYGVTIKTDFLKLKINELHAYYEYIMKEQAEKEEQQRIKAEMREEAKVLKEIEKLQKEAAKEEELYKKALDKAQKQLKEASEEQRNSLLSEINTLQQKLSEVEDKMQRAKSMAEQTKQGYVYVISNIGSFGENVYKIGMTRRLVPEDRIRELSNASVPFKFDIHALIHTDDAPKLENELHKMFANQKINKVNNRKEFFNVSIDEIEKAVNELHGEFRLTKLAEAFEYRQSVLFSPEPVQSAV
jgi:phage shock protein A